MTLEIAIIFAVIVWFYVELWKNAKKEFLRTFFMMFAFVHVIGGAFLGYAYAEANNLEYLKPIFRVFMINGAIILLLLFLFIILSQTRKGVKLIESLAKKLGKE
mgnify:CR=1 FL=1